MIQLFLQLHRCATSGRRAWALPAAWLLAMGLAPAAWAGPTSQCTKANSANGNANTCWSVFATNIAPNNFIYAPLNTCNKATTCYNGPTTDPPSKSMLINPSGSPNPRLAAQAQEVPNTFNPITFKCDSLNSTPSPNQNNCWSVFKKAPGRTPTYDRVEVSADNCKTSLRCWTNNTTVTDKCKVIPARGPVPPTSQLQNCPVSP